MRNQKGITLIALVITIIVLLILAGVTIAMLSGENGILTNANKANCENSYRSAQEQMGLAYMAVRTEIMAQKVAVSTYNPATLANTQALQAIVAQDLAGDSKFTAETVTASNLDNSTTPTKSYIRIKYTNNTIDQGLIDSTSTPVVPRYDTNVYGIIVIDGSGQTASFQYDVDSSAANYLN